MNGTDPRREKQIEGDRDESTSTMAGATDADADKQKSAWMRDDTRKRSAGGHIGNSENTGCRSVHAWDNYYSYSGYSLERGHAHTYACTGEREGMHSFSLLYTYY